MEWRKSSFSAASGNCVEVRQDLAAVRDSKSPAGPALAVGLTALVAAAKAGVTMEWHKSSFSDGGDCVEVRQDLTAIRDSKNPMGPTLAVEPTAFLQAIRRLPTP